MPTFAELADIRLHPQPAYPEYEQLRADAERTASRFADPRARYRMEQIVGRRGGDWCTAVLGYPYPGQGVGGITTFELHLLELADGRDLDPPLPDVVLRWRAEAAVWAAEQQRRRDAHTERDRQAWQTASVGCPVPLQVRPNTHGRRSGGYGESLRHVVPTVDAHSGSAKRPRLHPKSRALCETVSRTRPLQFGEPTDDPATCVRCLDYTPKIRPAE